MPKRKSYSRALRQLAEQLIATLAEVYDIPESEHEDLATSLVRQWITYDGNATLFLGKHQLYFVLSKTPLCQPCLVPEPAFPGRMDLFAQDWKISADELPEILQQLNRGQAVEVTNEEGLPLRLTVDPKKRRTQAERLVKQNPLLMISRDYHKFAARALEPLLHGRADADELEALTLSVVRQWREYEGHALLFLDAAKQTLIILTELDDGHCQVDVKEQGSKHEACLCSLGLSPDDVPEAIANLNLGQEVEFRDGDGILCRLRHDPRTGRLAVTPLDPVPLVVRASSAPIFCPNCNAVLRPWRKGEWQQFCPQCGHTVALA